MMANRTWATSIESLRNVSPREAATPRMISICDTQPITAAGMRALLDGSPDLRFAHACESLKQARDLISTETPDVLVLDNAFGIEAILRWLTDEITSASHCKNVGVLVWGSPVTEAGALRLLQAGARGILRKTAREETVLSCVRAVAEGRSWTEDYAFQDTSFHGHCRHYRLTPREQDILELVEQGFTNREIAAGLGIKPGTVKIHLKHLFHKTGISNRYRLALGGLQQRGMISSDATGLRSVL